MSPNAAPVPAAKVASDEVLFEETVALAEKMIAIPSVTGDEKSVLDFLCAQFSAWGWPFETIPVEEGRYDIFVPFGTPRVLFTTHVDVVPAPAHLFFPKRRDGRLYGRGACDAKGIAAVMIGACRRLQASGATDFGILIVIGEERDGAGAKAAAQKLQGRGIKYLVNGEPTELKMVVAHKGTLRVRIECIGRAAHSGYPEIGDDANAKLIRIANRLLDADFGSDPVLGKATTNVGLLHGGTAGNVVSPGAFLECVIRLVGEAEPVLKKVTELLKGEGEITEKSTMKLARMKTLPGFETHVASYGTDVPYFAPLTEECFLYGPGTIDLAHTEDEHVLLSELEQALGDYCRIYQTLS